MDCEKKYKEALEKAKIWQEHLYEVGDKDYADELNYIFPELCESENERIRKHIIEVIKNHFSGEDADKCIAYLEKQGEQKPAWSEEDEVRFQSCLNILQVQAKCFMGITETINTKWLKSLKQRYTWKPSDEQMKALDSAIDEFDGYREYDSLVSLKKDLEKLKGE